MWGGSVIVFCFFSLLMLIFTVMRIANTSEMSIYCNKNSLDLYTVKYYKNLETLVLFNASDENDFSRLSSNSVTELHIFHSNLSNLEFVSRFPCLTEISIINSNIDLTGVNNQSVKELYLWTCGFNGSLNLDGLSSLETVNIYQTESINLNSFTKLNNLTELYLSNINRISNSCESEHISSVRKLTVYGPETCFDISMFEKMENLESITISAELLDSALYNSLVERGVEVITVNN